MMVESRRRGAALGWMFAGSLCLVIFACSRADYQGSELVCGQGGLCPSGYQCCADNICRTRCVDEGAESAVCGEDTIEAECYVPDGELDPFDEVYCAEDDLCWQRKTFAWALTFLEAESYCNSLRLAVFSDWRLPNLDELRTLVDGCSASVAGGACGVRDDCSICATPVCWTRDLCEGCGDGFGPGPGNCYWHGTFGAECELWFWSSTRCSDESNNYWFVDFQSGNIYHEWHANAEKVTVRCVRP